MLSVEYMCLTEGQMMSPYGPSLLKKGSLFSCSRENMMMGRVKTKVFPEPVKAIPIMSRPDRLQTNTVNTQTVYMYLIYITYSDVYYSLFV